MDAAAVGFGRVIEIGVFIFNEGDGAAFWMMLRSFFDLTFSTDAGMADGAGFPRRGLVVAHLISSFKVQDSFIIDDFGEFW